MTHSRSIFLAAIVAVAALAILIFVRPDRAAPASQPAPDDTDPATLVGKPAPDFNLKSTDGASHALAETKGHVLVLDFFASWCIPCRLEQKHLMQLYPDLQPQGLQVFAIDTNDDPAKVPQYVSDNHLTLPVLLDPDGSVGNAYKVNQMPETVIIGKDGTVRQVFDSFSEDKTPPLLEQAIKSALSESN
jgi:peroxiredoxin